MIKFNLGVLLAERNLNINKVHKDTGLSRITLSAISNNNGQGIQLETLNKLCQYLKITPGELFLYVPYDIEINNIEYSDNINATLDLIVKNEYNKYILNISFKTIVLKKDANCFNVTFEFYLKDMNFNKESYLIIKEMFENNKDTIDIFIKTFKNKIDNEIFKKLVLIKKNDHFSYDYGIISSDILRIFKYSRNEIVHNSIINNILNVLEK